MAISKDKERIAISLTRDQLKDLELLSKETGISKSNLIQIAIMQLIRKTPLSQIVDDQSAL